MFAFVSQSLDWILYKRPHILPIFFAWLWTVWFSKVIPAKWYKIFKDNHNPTTSVIIPVVDEEDQLFRKVLKEITEQKPSQVIVVANGTHSPTILQASIDYNVEYLYLETAGKRGAIAEGLKRVTNEVTVLVDSDTLWTENTLKELVKPFSNPRVGGVTTHQKILSPERNLLTRFANWMEETRSSNSMPAQSVFGRVGCLPGRTIAFRTSILKEVIDEFLTDEFLGVHLEISDDRTLTNYTLKLGYDTVYQRSSVVYTDAPVKLGAFVKQQYRWARGSQYNTIRMWPWLITHAPLTGLHFTSDVVTPFLTVGMLVHMFKSIFGRKKKDYKLLNSPRFASWKVQVPLAVIGACISAGIKNIYQIRKDPKEVVRLPIYAVLLTVLMTPIRIWGFMTSAYHASWMTRKNAYKGTLQKKRSWKQHIPLLSGLLALGLVIWGGLKSP